MIVLSIGCDNLYMFKDFFLDFTYERKLTHPLAEEDTPFPEAKIKVRKNILILGANAAGKTTFAKLLCAICNFVIGRTMNNEQLNLFAAINDVNKNASFTIEFILNQDAYRISCEFNREGILQQNVKKTKVFKSYNIKKLREVLDDVEPFDNYNDGKSRYLGETRYMSRMATTFDSKNTQEMQRFLREIAFHYIFSRFSESSLTGSIMKAPIEVLNNLLPLIDNSVSQVLPMHTADKSIATASYLIQFKNGSQLTIPEGNLFKTSDRDRLSHGTCEAISFLNVLEEIKSDAGVLIFVDEQLAHMHAELEAFLIMKAFYMEKKAQLFFTSHNTELLDLNLPNTCYLLFKRNSEGYNEAFFINEKLSKNDRSIKNYYDNDYFGMKPDFSSLDEYIDQYLYENS